MITINSKKEKNAVSKAVETLKKGGLIIYPTETVYGLGCDVTNQKAVNKLLKYKARREGKPLSIAVENKKMAEKFVELNNTAKSIYKKFLPGPVTVVSKGKHKVAKGVESEAGTLGIRIPNYPLVLKIVKAFGKPITATSANASNKKRPYKTEDIFNNISKKQSALIDLVLDAGTLPTREPSTVIDTTQGEITTLRQGDIILEKKKETKTKSEQETIELGKKITNQHRHYLGFKSIIFCLKGEMGSGKTQFAKGIANALGIKERISSPTYVIEEEYTFLHNKKKKHLYHIDTWRMSDESEFTSLEIEKIIANGNILAIEWADRVVSAIEKFKDDAKIIWVTLEYGKDTEERIVRWGNNKTK